MSKTQTVKFFRCRHCGKIIAVIDDPGVPTICCGEEMQELKANTTDGAIEKHVPSVKVEGDKVFVTVGKVEHPMQEDHWIKWIYVQTQNGGQRKILNPGDKPIAEFSLCNDEPLVVYEYCNKHGLWKTEL